MSPSRLRRAALAVVLPALAASAFAPGAQAADPPVLDLERLTGLQSQKLMNEGKLTSVQLTQAYIDRINALNKRGPGLNAVTQFNKNALLEAAASDERRKAGELLSAADGLPIVMKDLVDVKGMYTSNGNWSLRNSFPANDSGIARNIRKSGVVILGKLGLTEYANSFGNQPQGFGNLTGQVLNGLDTDASPVGSSSGSGTASAVALSALTVGTETSGSNIAPAVVQGTVAIRPTVGLVPGIGVGPIAASQDTAGPADKSVEDTALTLQAIAGFDEANAASAVGMWGPGVDPDFIVPPVPKPTPDYVSALDLNYVQGKRIGYNGDISPGTPMREAYDALIAAGAIMVERPIIAPIGLPAGVNSYEAHRDIDRYYANLGPDAPIKSLAEEIADNRANAHEALKFGNNSHANAEAIDISPDSAASVTYRANLVQGKLAARTAIDTMLKNDTPDDPSDDFVAILGRVIAGSDQYGHSLGSRAGYPQMTIPMGYNAEKRAPLNVLLHGTKYTERDLIGIGYVIEQATKKHKTASELSPHIYRCTKTVPAPPASDRGSCNPDYDTIMAAIGERPALGFSLETASVKDLQDRMTEGTLTAEDLTKAYLARIALTNAEGPATQAVRSVDLGAIDRAKQLDADREETGTLGPLHGIPVLISESIDVKGTPTSAGSIALQNSTPTADAKLVARLRGSGAIILGKTNVGEFNGVFDANAPEGFSSLGGQVLLPSDTDKTVAGSSAGAAAATASGLAAATIGLETSTDTAQLISASGVAGVVGLKPTVGRISRTGVLGVAKSQDAPGPITRTVYDAATQLQVMAVRDGADPGTTGAPTAPDYRIALRTNALRGKNVAVVSSNVVPYTEAITSVQDLGATTTTKTIGTPSPNPPSIVGREFKRDLNAYLSGIPGAGAKSLSAIIDYNEEHADESLRYQQRDLEAADAIDLTDDAVKAEYESDRDTGKASNQALIDELLNNATPADTTDDATVVMVPHAHALVGIADRAGYPMLTVPAGYGTGNAGRNPIGITFIAKAFDEIGLLAAGYAFEQKTQVRLAPSWTNPSMWRCVPGSTFFKPHHCNPGDRLYTQTFTPVPGAPTEPAGPETPAPTPDPPVVPA
ncbi:MAG: hypothetical protein JHC84_17885, partial [Solirubrobacteraceae bacterium]|nr:hypothetical protein [Solirubrobacteraceae bacterium]